VLKFSLKPVDVRISGQRIDRTTRHLEGTSQKERHFKSKEKVLGQFFTPPEVADFIVSLASFNLTRKRTGCDPACGDGVFLSSMIRQGFNEVVGMDVDEACLEGIPMDVKEGAKVFVGDALRRMMTPLGEKPPLQDDYFDLVVGNPPFSAKYGRVKDRAILSSYKLGYGLRSQAIEVLFLERFLQLARKGGVIGIILPDGVFLNLKYRRIRRFILDECRVLAVVSLPRGIFNSSKPTTSKTSILFAMKGEGHKGEVFMAEVGSRGELERFLKLYRTHKSDSNSVWVEVTPDSLHPKMYLKPELPEFRHPTHKLGELIDEMLCGGTEYGEKRSFTDKGLRFISAKVVTPLGIDFTRDHRKFIEPGGPMDKRRAHVKVGDLLFVRVGVGCIGRAAVVMDEEELGVADDWIYIIRPNRGVISPYYLAIFLQSRYGRMQIDAFKRGVGTVTIPQKLLKEVIIPKPSVSFQDKIEGLYKEMVKARRAGLYQRAWEIYNKMVEDLESLLSQRPPP